MAADMGTFKESLDVLTTALGSGLPLREFYNRSAKFEFEDCLNFVSATVTTRLPSGCMVQESCGTR